MRSFGGVADVMVGAAAGYVGTKVMEPVGMALYRAEPSDARAKEDAARPGPPYRLAAEKTTKALGLGLSDEAMARAALGFHYGLAVSWAPLYALLRRRARLGMLPAALATGAAMSAIVDEGLTPLLGFSAPNRAYPLVAHLRGVAAHLVFGAAVGAVYETLWALTGRRPQTQRAGRS